MSQTSQEATPMRGVDTHAHIFRRDLPMDSARRYTPDYDVAADDFLAQCHTANITHGVLIQPSFLGTDNHFMEEALRRYPQNLRGIAVIDPLGTDGEDEDELDRLAANGVVGIRLNLIGKPLPDFSQAAWQTLLKNIAKRAWQIEIHRAASDLPALIRPLIAAGVAVVLDHFALPDPALSWRDPALQEIITLARSGLVWIKLSAAYRTHCNPADLASLATTLLENVGTHRLLWGSDWPHTQHETTENYLACHAQLTQWVPHSADRQKILVDTPTQLFKFV